MCLVPLAGVSEGNQQRPALPGEPAHGRQERRVDPRLPAAGDGGQDERAGERERDAPTQGERWCARIRQSGDLRQTMSTLQH